MRPRSAQACVCGVHGLFIAHTACMTILLDALQLSVPADRMRLALFAYRLRLAPDGAPPRRIGPFTSAAQIGPVAVGALTLGGEESAGESPVSVMSDFVVRILR